MALPLRSHLQHTACRSASQPSPGHFPLLLVQLCVPDSNAVGRAHRAGQQAGGHRAPAGVRHLGPSAAGRHVRRVCRWGGGGGSDAQNRRARVVRPARMLHVPRLLTGHSLGSPPRKALPVQRPRRALCRRQSEWRGGTTAWRRAAAAARMHCSVPHVHMCLCLCIMSATLCSWSGRVSRAAPLPSLAGWARAQGLRQPLPPRSAQRTWAPSAPEGAAAVSQSAASQTDGEQPLDAAFQAKLDLLAVWREKYYDCIVPRKARPGEGV